jgi:hypothetical protein
MMNQIVISFCWLVFLSSESVWCQSLAITSVTQPTLWLIEDAGKLKSEAVMAVTSDQAVPAWAKITVPGQAAYLEALGILAIGANSRMIHVLELNTAKASVKFEVFTNAQGTGVPLASLVVEQKIIRRWKMYTSTDCHVDIGYTHYQEHLKHVLYPQYLDAAFEYIQATATWPLESRFTYPIESAFMIYDGVMLARNADWLETMKGHLRTGRLSYPGSYFNYTFETMGTEEIARASYIPMRHLPDMLGVPAQKVGFMTDNPGFSWAAVDALVEAGIKSYRLRFNDDRNWSRWDISKYPQMFFLQGQNPRNKLLVWNGPHYVSENQPIGPNFGFQGTSSEACYTQVMAWFTKLEKDGWAYDSWLSTFTDGGDNRGIPLNPMARVKGVNDLIAAKGYAYPKLIFSNNGDFFDHILADYASIVPVFKGHIESWWNLGVPSTAYETGRNNDAQDKLAAAETFATMAQLSVPSLGYPQERLTLGWKNLVTWDEHTWGSASRGVDEQWFWKRNSALIADGTAEAVLDKSLKALASRLQTGWWSVVVYNGLTWERNDLVKVSLAELPKFFDIVDIATTKPVKYQKMENGDIQFVAEKVPGLGYKTYQVNYRTNEPTFTGTIRSTANTLENDFFKVTFDATGSVSSILDKNSNNRELVDIAAPMKFNQLQANVTGAVTSAKLYPKVGALTGEMIADGFTGAVGIESLQRHIILYDNLPRIDIANKVLRGTEGDKTDYHFTFPFNVNDFTIRHEMPSGAFMPLVSANTKDPKLEQFFTSATDQYAVNRWVDISSTLGYGITFCPLTAPMVSYGGRRANSWDVNYNHKDPWIWSMIYNNHWFTNFQATQPSSTTFLYSFRPHTGRNWVESDATHFGSEQASPLRAVVVNHAQSGIVDGGMGQFMAIDKPNVVLSTAKIAEANSDGLILRFNEISGSDTHVTVDLSWIKPTEAMETDLVENDRAPMGLDSSKLTFDIGAHGWKTVRVRGGIAPAQITGLKTVVMTDGCRITWDKLMDAKLDYYEVFRSRQASFEVGSGSYLATTPGNWFFDRQASQDIKGTYYYRVRAKASGLNGAPSVPTATTSGAYLDKQAPSIPELVRVERLHGSRVSLEWNPSVDDKYVAGYDIYRDGVKLITVDAILNSHLDVLASALSNTPFYQVVAFDAAGNRSSLGKAMTSGPVIPDWINLSTQATVSASTEFDAGHGKEKAIDGVYGKQDIGEWASAGEANPWIQLDWKSTQGVRAIVLYDRSNGFENVNNGTLSFSDGSSLKILGLPTWGEGRMISFPWKDITWVRFQAEDGSGPNGGISEITVLGENRIPIAILTPQKEAGAWKTKDGYGGIGNSNGGSKVSKASKIIAEEQP